ncbi:MAG: putative leader peptide [Pseudonocardia sp.]
MPATSLRLDQPTLVRRLHVDLMRISAAACRPTV